MSALPARKPRISSAKNPIATDENLTKLLAETKDLDTEEAFSGWKDSFLEQYKKYLDPAGVENAEMSNNRLVGSLEKLAASVVTVNKFVSEDKITAESQSVQGKRHLTNMTDQMAATEKEVARFMPTTGAEEAEMGYDKFELGAVMIEDGFRVYEHLKTTKDIVEHLQAKVLNEVLPSNKLSIIQFYLRQIQTFCDVMADLGLFGLMEKMMDIYQIKPRSKTKPEKPAPRPPSSSPKQEKPEKPKRVLDPNKKYNHRAAYTSGYFDPFSGTQPGREEYESDKSEKGDDNDQEGEGEDDDEHFIIYFDMKTGTIGKIPRNFCAKSNFIISNDEDGAEQMQGQIDDDAEKEQLLWDMKKALKGNAPLTPKQGPRRARSPKNKGDMAKTRPPLDEKASIARSKSGDLVGGSKNGKSSPPRGARESQPPRAKSLPQNPLRSSSPAVLSSGGLPQKKRGDSKNYQSPEPDEDDEDPSEVSTELNDIMEAVEVRPSRRSRPSVADAPSTPVKRTSSARSKSPGRLSKTKLDDDAVDPQDPVKKVGSTTRSKSPGRLSKIKSYEDTEDGDDMTETKSGRRTRTSSAQDSGTMTRTGRSKSPGPMRDVKSSGSNGWSGANIVGDPTRKAPRRSRSTDGSGFELGEARQTRSRQPPVRTKSTPLSAVAGETNDTRASVGRSKSPGALRLSGSPVQSKPRPSASGWASPGALAAKRRSVAVVNGSIANPY